MLIKCFNSMSGHELDDSPRKYAYNTIYLLLNVGNEDLICHSYVTNSLNHVISNIGWDVQIDCLISYWLAPEINLKYNINNQLCPSDEYFIY